MWILQAVHTCTAAGPIVSRCITPPTNCFIRVKSGSDIDPEASSIHTRSYSRGSRSQMPLKMQTRSEVTVGGASSRNPAEQFVTERHWRSDVNVFAAAAYSSDPHTETLAHSRSWRTPGGVRSNCPGKHAVAFAHWVSVNAVQSVETNCSDGQVVAQAVQLMSAVAEHGATKNVPLLHENEQLWHTRSVVEEHAVASNVNGAHAPRHVEHCVFDVAVHCVEANCSGPSQRSHAWHARSDVSVGSAVMNAVTPHVWTGLHTVLLVPPHCATMNSFERHTSHTVSLKKVCDVAPSSTKLATSMTLEVSPPTIVVNSARFADPTERAYLYAWDIGSAR
jgi:hypothetical protein